MRACGLLGLSLAALLMVPLARNAEAAGATDCSGPASAACYFSVDAAGAAGRFHYYASRAPGTPPSGPGPTAALLALHGHPRDANKTFDAALLAVTRAGAVDQTLVVAPVFQVDARQAPKCQTSGVPAAQTGDLLWTCQSWMEGGAAGNGQEGMSSFAAMDALVAELARQWPSLRSITIAGFSAGAQMVQHYIGFAAALPAGSPAVRYVVSDPGTWLYFDTVRPQPARNGLAADWATCSGGPDFLGGCGMEFKAMAAACSAANQWKYGTDSLPVLLGRSAVEARAHYAAADVSYLAGELDTGSAPGTFYKILDKSCAAQAQGPYRLQRGLAYAAYDRALLAPAKQRKLVVVPGCAHDVACVFPSQAARAALLGP